MAANRDRTEAIQIDRWQREVTRTMDKIEETSIIHDVKADLSEIHDLTNPRFFDPQDLEEMELTEKALAEYHKRLKANVGCLRALRRDQRAHT